MRRWLTIGLVVVGFVAAWLVTPAMAIDIQNTAHDFTSTGPNATFKDAGAYCITCHTPHHSTQSVLMWNHTLSAQTLTFGNNAATTAGTPLPTSIGSWSGSTKLCLSCHDGTVNVGSLIHDAWTSGGNVKITNTDKIVGPNLAGNHPVAVPYPNPSSGTYNGITTAAVSTDYVAAATAGTSVKLFPDPTTAQKGIECASCHNPHKNATADGKFLRVLYANLCTTCHVK